MALPFLFAGKMLKWGHEVGSSLPLAFNDVFLYRFEMFLNYSILFFTELYSLNSTAYCAIIAYIEIFTNAGKCHPALTPDKIYSDISR